MKFSIRDLLWVTVVVAMAVSAWLDHRRMERMELLRTIGRFGGSYASRKQILLPSPSAPATNLPSHQPGKSNDITTPDQDCLPLPAPIR